MMKKKCFIHFGLHKTATSSFQECCYKNREYLRSLGLNFNSFFCEQKNQYNLINHSIPLYTLFSENPQFYHINLSWKVTDALEDIKSSYQKQFDKLLKSENILISGEDLSLLKDSELKNFINNIVNNDFEIYPFALYRKPYSYFCSQLQETIKKGEYAPFIRFKFQKPSPKYDLQTYLNYLTQSKRIKNLISFFGDKIIFQNFEDTLNEPNGPIGFILSNFLKLDASKFIYPSDNSNTSKSNLHIRLQNFLNKREPRFRGRNLNSNCFIINKEFKCEKKFVLTEEEYELFKKPLEDEISFFKKHLGYSFKNDEIIFSEEFTLDDLIKTICSSL